VVVAPRGRRDADEDAVHEERHRRFLHPQPRPANGAGDDIAQHQHAEGRDADPAQDHQQIF
jgi:hypothetical protein